MKLLYEETPKGFEEVLVSLLSMKIDLSVGLIFTQQTKEKNGIPDLIITQKSFSIVFETKLTDWFYEAQILRHLEGFKQNNDYKILFLLSNFEIEDFELDEQIRGRFPKAFQLAEERTIIIKAISFEYFVEILENVMHSELFKKFLHEFKLYLDRNNLMPKWRYLLDVVNCTGSLDELQQNFYMCPDTGGAYSHRRAKFLGPYARKQVEKIFEIRAVVSIAQNLGEATVKWNNSGESPEQLIADAKAMIQNSQSRVDENKTVALQVFLLEKAESTCFKKTDRGGMYGVKKYFWDIAINCKDSKELAIFLNGKGWNEFQN